MPYRNYDEFIQGVEDNPKLARLRVMRARKAGVPIVDDDNEGYKEKTLSKRMGRMAKTPTKSITKTPVKSKYSPGVLRKRMTAAKIEDEAVAKRKKVGY